MRNLSIGEIVTILLLLVCAAIFFIKPIKKVIEESLSLSILQAFFFFGMALACMGHIMEIQGDHIIVHWMWIFPTIAVIGLLTSAMSPIEIPHSVRKELNEREYGGGGPR